MRELPDKLLDDNLYGQWASAIEDTYMNVHQRYLTVRRYVTYVNIVINFSHLSKHASNNERYT